MQMEGAKIIRYGRDTWDTYFCFDIEGEMSTPMEYDNSRTRHFSSGFQSFVFSIRYQFIIHIFCAAV